MKDFLGLRRIIISYGISLHYFDGFGVVGLEYTSAPLTALKVGRHICGVILPAFKEEKRTVFLVGGSLDREDMIRKKLLDLMQGGSDLSVCMPEDMFIGLFKRPRYDLLGLENTLAESVHCVVICAESPGSLTELGAFASHERLRAKLVVVVDQIYRGQTSFIRYGPLKVIQRNSFGRVIWYDGNLDPTCVGLHSRVVRAVHEVASNGEIRTDLQNPVLAALFILCMLDLLDELEWQSLAYVVRDISGVDSDSCRTIVEAAKDMLVTRRRIRSRNGILSLTRGGVDYLRDTVSFSGVADDLDRERIRIMNRIYRRKY